MQERSNEQAGHSRALVASVFADAPEHEREILDKVTRIIEVERERLRPELGKGGYHARGFVPRTTDTVDTMGWDDLLLHPGVIERCAGGAGSKETAIIQMVLTHCRPQNRIAFTWMKGCYLVIEASASKAGEAAFDVAMTAVRALKNHHEQLKTTKQREIACKGGKAANAKHAMNAGQIKAAWASGKYTTRDICADEEWKALGFGSYGTARRHLQGTPDPDPWPAKVRPPG